MEIQTVEKIRVLIVQTDEDRTFLLHNNRWQPWNKTDLVTPDLAQELDEAYQQWCREDLRQ